MKTVREVVEELKIFERNKVPLEIKMLGIATYIQTYSTRRTAKILSELHPVSYYAVHKLGKDASGRTADFYGEKEKKSYSNRLNCC